MVLFDEFSSAFALKPCVDIVSNGPAIVHFPTVLCIDAAAITLAVSSQQKHPAPEA